MAIVAHEPSKEGAGFFLIDAVDFFLSKNFEVLVICPAPGPLSDALILRGVECRYAPSPWWWHRTCQDGIPYRATMDAALLMKDILEKWGANIVYTNTIVAPAGPLAAALTGLPHIWHIHEFAYNPEAIVMSLPKKDLAALISQTSNAIIFNSRAVASEWDGFFKDVRTAIVYNWTGILQQKEKQEPSRAPDLGGRRFFSHIASVSRWKGQIQSLRALKALVDTGHDVVIVFAGPITEPQYHQELCEYIQINSLDDNVRFVGYMETPARVLNQAVGGLVCSRLEPFGRVTIESMAAGVPVIGADSAGTAEIVQDEVSGLLFPPGDVEALARQMLRLLSDSGLRSRLVANGLERVKRFNSPETEMQPVLGMMKELISARNPSWPLGYSLAFGMAVRDINPSAPGLKSFRDYLDRICRKLSRALKLS